MWAAGLLVALAVGFAPARAAADWPILDRLHQHGNCPKDQQETIRIPGREIRIITAKPQVIVSDASPRLRGFFPANGNAMTFGQGPFIATLMPMNLQGGATFGTCGAQPSAASAALRALHEMEIHAGEIAAMRAAQKAQMDHLDAVQKRVQASMSASFGAGSSSDSADLQKTLQSLDKRISDIERLLIVHDNLLKEKAK